MYKALLFGLGATVAIVSLLSGTTTIDNYEQWKQQHSFDFGSREDFYRKMIFKLTEK